MMATARTVPPLVIPFGTTGGANEASVPIDYALIGKPLDDLLSTFINRLERDTSTGRWHEALPMILYGHVFVARNSFHTMRYFCATSPEDAARRPEFVLSCPPLLREMVDAISNVVLLGQDPVAQTERYLHSGWRDLEGNSRRLRKLYGNDPGQKAFLDANADRVLDYRQRFGIDARRAAGIQKIDPWPRLGQLLKDPVLFDDRRQFLSLLEDWHYAHFSQDTHLALPGLIRRTRMMTNEERRAAALVQLENARSDMVAVGSTLVATLLSEMELIVALDVGPRLREAWELLIPAWPDAAAIYADRYAGRW
jgi:hypothetical protein